jgi:hypothetical protein
MHKLPLIAAAIILLTGAATAETITIVTGEEVDIMAGDGTEHTIELRAVTNQSQAAFYVDGQLMELDAGESFQVAGQQVPVTAVERYGQMNGSMTINATLADDGDDEAGTGGVLTLATGEVQTITVEGDEYTLEPRAVTDGPNVALYVDGRLSEHEEGETFQIGAMEVVVMTIERDGSDSTQGRLQLNMTGLPGDEDDDVEPIEWDTVSSEDDEQEEDTERNEGDQERTDQDEDTEQDRPGTLTIRTGESAIVTADGQRYEIEPRAVTEGPNVALEVNGRLSEHAEGEMFQLGDTDVAILTIERLSGEEGAGRVTINATGRIEDETVDTPVESPENGSQPAERSIDLTEGWNTISVSSQLDARELAEQCSLRRYQDELVWQYRDGGWTHPTTLQPQQGYYINAAESCQVTYTPDLSTDRYTPLELETGWNMVGTAEDIGSAVFTNQCEVRRYQGAALLSYRSGWQETAMNDGLDPETGYFINVAEPCTIEWRR